MDSEKDNIIFIVEEDSVVGKVLANTELILPNRIDKVLRVFPGLTGNETKSSFYAIPVWQAAMLGSLAALAGWWLMETYFPNDSFVINPFGDFTGLYWLTNAIPAGIIGIFLGSLEGLKSRDWIKLLWNASQALALTISGGVLGSFLAQVAYLYLESISGGHLFISTLAQILGWTILGLFIGLGQAIVSYNGSKMGYGMISGLIGGLFGGLLFSLIESQVPGGIIARMAAYGIMGGSIGCAVGLADRQKPNNCR